MCNILHAGIFLLDDEVGPAVLFAGRYSVYVGPDSVCSSSDYLPVHQHSLLDLSPSRYLLLTVETVPEDVNSMA
jgi:hypothetical protein